MKKLVQKSLGVMLILLFVCSSFFGCKNEDVTNYCGIFEEPHENENEIYLDNPTELKFFYLTAKRKIGKELLYLKVSDDADEGLHVVDDYLNYSFFYEKEENSKLVNSYIVSRTSIYDVALGNSTDGDAPYFSFSVDFGSRGCRRIKRNMKIVFEDAPPNDFGWTRVAYVYNGNKIAGEARFSFSLDISDSDLEEFLKKHLVVLR